MSRGVFTMKQVAAAGLRRNDPAAHAQQVKDGYIDGVPAPPRRYQRQHARLRPRRR